ncbi:PRC-barrel domain-containing protein [Sabulicella glaciei]|uniref:PRC-barrel domain-containing protein n=1 Tax=Sabulicella glaciei TaxID=2984948 RepID=A0ABT3NVJ7_9PROT|nr:PRC-barrel domain-containing protein [Roseococcus sp. MDT2-1-1]MCW8086188.1 PRC-barrel domain-containing protein [Roseococcus sp. MDT2-1-1]
MTQRIPASLVALSLLAAGPAFAQGTAPAQGRGNAPAQSAQPSQSQPAPANQQAQPPGQAAQAQSQGQAGAENCQAEVNAFGRTMEEEGFWLDGYRQGMATTPAAAGAMPRGTAVPPGTAPNMGQGAGGRSDTSTATTGQQAAPAAQQQAAPRDPMARMDWSAAPVQSLRTLYAAAHVLAANGSDAACRTVLAEARQLYGAYTAQIRQAGIEPGEIRSYRQSQLALARPVTEMGHGMRVDEITGTDVRNPQDQRLGTVQDVVLDPRSGQIAYAVLGRGGFLGIGRDYVAVPWSQMRATPGMRSFVLDVTEQRLEQAPQVERNAFANEADFTRRRGEIDRFWSGRAG